MKRTMNRVFGGLAALTLLWPMAVQAGEMKTTLTVKGMSCDACPPAVSKALKGVNGVKDVQVSLEKKEAVVVADESVKADALVTAVTKAGFSASVAEGK